MAIMKVAGKQIVDADIFETVIAHFPDVIQSVDGEGNIVFVNAAVERMLGYTTEEYLSMNIRDLYVEQPGLNTGFEDLKTAGEIAVQSLVRTKSGEDLPVELRSFAIYDDDGDFLCSFTIMRDLTRTSEERSPCGGRF